MADLVRVRLDGYEKNLGRAYAVAHGLEILDEPTRNRNGNLRPTTRVGGRPAKPKTTVAELVAERDIEQKSPEQAAVIEPAPTEKEQDR